MQLHNNNELNVKKLIGRQLNNGSPEWTNEQSFKAAYAVGADQKISHRRVLPFQLTPKQSTFSIHITTHSIFDLTLVMTSVGALVEHNVPVEEFPLSWENTFSLPSITGSDLKLDLNDETAMSSPT